ncbi:hypothetical protein Acsp03_24650 [Actinomadura sp. NBRC 104412]|uniref:tyrosine-type recombinase/integrase n=1 Tax=Actinomadura sp. NBRC 104412 TaxID=3032203 RepID=UPI0024A28B46|nr:site-specific integrase [Actinomadura sp. NBRC 104412]GLZ04999.1 hypothetical protein Acsp03_24650 [Actinomadura sp. NBRC 104412]
MASIQKRPSGKWRARYRDGAGKEHAKHFARKVDAQRWLDEVTASIKTGQYVDPAAGRITFADYFADWSKRQIWVSGTERAMRLAAESTTFRDVPLSSLRRSHVEAWIKAMQTKDRGEDRTAGLAAGTIRTRFNNVRAVLRAAVRDRVIISDPSEGVTLPRGRRAAAAMRLPTVEEVAALLDGAAPPFRAFVALAAFAGLRLGEAAGLRVGDVNFLGRSLDVVRQVQRERGGVEIRAPKYGSERTVYLADELVNILARHVEAYRPGDDPARWLFVGDGDAPPHQNSIGYQWRRAQRAAGVSGMKLHDLRHFYASGLIAAGCDVVTVQRALGHAKATTTLNTYAHLWPTAEDRTRKAAALLAETLGADSLRTREA